MFAKSYIWGILLYCVSRGEGGNAKAMLLTSVVNTWSERSITKLEYNSGTLYVGLSNCQKRLQMWLENKMQLNFAPIDFISLTDPSQNKYWDANKIIYERQRFYF